MQTMSPMCQKSSGSRKLRKLLLAVILTVFLFDSANAQKTEFSQDSAYAVLETLVAEIGPRPMGSPAEQRALAFAVSKFSEYGCQESYVMQMTVAGGVNTNSGIAVGVLKGKRAGRIIIIGGHIDSSGPEVPGANDDGSGVACVIELARVLGKLHHESTVVFCCWGGEEEGLRGSEYFVEHYNDIDSVGLMIQIDMADGSSWLEIDPDAEGTSAPRWLVQAAFDVFYDDLGYGGLVYPTHSATLKSALRGVAGSDHIPFLKKGIPAVDFTSDVNYPIHTPQDNLDNFSMSGLQRAGDLVLKLFEHFDSGVPSRTTESYLLLQLGNKPLFVDYWVVWCFVVLCVVLGVTTVFIARKRREIDESSNRVKWSGLKLLLFWVIIQTFVWYSENVVGLIRGYRFPWVNNFSGFIILGILFGLIGLWIVLHLAGRLRLGPDQYSYTRIGFVLFVVCVALTSLSSPELAIYPAMGLLFFSLAMLARRPILKLALFAFAPYMMLRLVFSESLELLQRLLAGNTLHSISASTLYNAGFVLFFGLFSLPFLFGFAAVYRDSKVDLLWLKKFRSKTGLIVVSVAAGGVMMYLLFRPVYDERWHNRVRIEQKFALGSDSSTITMTGNEFLTGLSMKVGRKDSLLNERVNFVNFQPEQPSTVSWCSVDTWNIVPESKANDSTRLIDRCVKIYSQLRPMKIGISYRSSQEFKVESPWSFSSGGSRRKEVGFVKTLSWYSFPDSNLSIPITFTLKDSQQVVEEIEVSYDTLSYPIRMSRQLTNFFMRTVVTALDTFGVKADHPG